MALVPPSAAARLSSVRHPTAEEDVMHSHAMGWLDWSLMIGSYVAVLALLTTVAVLLVRGARGR